MIDAMDPTSYGTDTVYAVDKVESGQEEKIDEEGDAGGNETMKIEKKKR